MEELGQVPQQLGERDHPVLERLARVAHEVWRVVSFQAFTPDGPIVNHGDHPNLVHTNEVKAA